MMEAEEVVETLSFLINALKPKREGERREIGW
jgi:hypothetical protein